MFVCLNRIQETHQIISIVPASPGSSLKPLLSSLQLALDHPGSQILNNLRRNVQLLQPCSHKLRPLIQNLQYLQCLQYLQYLPVLLPGSLLLLLRALLLPRNARISSSLHSSKFVVTLPGEPLERQCQVSNLNASHLLCTKNKQEDTRAEQDRRLTATFFSLREAWTTPSSS